MSRTYIKGTNQPRTRSAVALLAHDRPGGVQGGGKRSRARRDRQTSKRDLRAGRWDA